MNNQPAPETLPFCPRCGVNIPDMAEDDDEYAYHCSECDLQVSESFNFCSRCGANIGAVEEEEEPSNVEDPTTAEQVIGRLEPPVPKTTVPELSPDTTSPQTSAEPDPNDMLRLTQLIYLDTKNRWGSFLEKEAEGNALLRVPSLNIGQRDDVIRIAQRFWERESTLPTFGLHREKFRRWAAQHNVLDKFYDRMELFYLGQQFRYLLTDLYDQQLADAVLEQPAPG